MYQKKKNSTSRNADPAAKNLYTEVSIHVYTLMLMQPHMSVYTGTVTYAQIFMCTHLFNVALRNAHVYTHPQT